MTPQRQRTIARTWSAVVVGSLLCGSCAWFRPAVYNGFADPAEAVARAQSDRWAEAKEADVRATSRPAPGAGPLELSVADAVLRALENNQELRVERLNPLIRRTFEAQARAAFGPVVSAEVSHSRAESDRAGLGSRTDATTGSIGVSTFLPTGTTVGVEAAGEHTEDTAAPTSGTARLGLTVTQALLEGRGLGVNLANLRQARLDVLTSEYELRGFAEALVAEVESASWDEVLARRRIAIYTDSLALAERQLAETDERIKVGTVAETERAAAQAEVARRREDLINARSALATVRLRLLRLVNPGGPG